MIAEKQKQKQKQKQQTAVTTFLTFLFLYHCNMAKYPPEECSTNKHRKRY